MKPEIKKRIEQIKKGVAPEGYKKTKVGIVPDEWQEVRLGDVCTINNNVLSENTQSNFEFWYIDLSSVDKGKIAHPTLAVKFEELPSRARRLFKKDDILMSTVRPYLLGFAYIDKEYDHYVCSTGFAVIRAKEAVCSKFVYYTLFSDGVIRQMNQRLMGTNYPALNNDDVYQLHFELPPLPEQEKIAKILSTWDKAIELKEQLIAGKKQQKKWLMQNLLTGEKRHPEWQKIRLGDIGDTYTGLSGKSKDDFGYGKYFIPYKNIFENAVIDTNKLEFVSISESEKQNKVLYGDIFFTTSSETPDEVGMSAVYLDNIDHVYLNSFCIGFRLNDFDTLLPEFACYYFRGSYFRSILNVLAQGATRYNLSRSSLVKIRIKLPTISEQTAIAEILSTADREIDLHEKQLEELKKQKKALMQLLLTGIVRINVQEVS